MIVDSQCNRCKHLDRGELERSGMLTCAAFPAAIPTVIQLNKFNHRHPYLGDHGIRFEPIAAEPPWKPPRPA